MKKFFYSVAFILFGFMSMLSTIYHGAALIFYDDNCLVTFCHSNLTIMYIGIVMMIGWISTLLLVFIAKYRLREDIAKKILISWIIISSLPYLINFF